MNQNPDNRWTPEIRSRITIKRGREVSGASGRHRGRAVDREPGALSVLIGFVVDVLLTLIT
jgi:hypothetical protein